jgi:hypothetical protein
MHPASGDAIYGRLVVRSGFDDQLYVPSRVTPNRAAYEVSFTESSDEASACSGSSAARKGWALTPVTSEAIGLPAAIRAPLQF